MTQDKLTDAVRAIIRKVQHWGTGSVRIALLLRRKLTKISNYPRPISVFFFTPLVRFGKV